MDSINLVVILDALGKAGVLGAAALVIWALMTDRLVTRSRIEYERTMYEAALRREIERREAMRAGLETRVQEANMRWAEERQRLLATLALHEAKFGKHLQMLETLDTHMERLSEQIESAKLLEAVRRAEDAKRREDRRRDVKFEAVD